MVKDSFEENMRKLLGDSYVGEELEKADPVEEALNFLQKGEKTEVKKKPEEKKKEQPKNTSEKSGLIPKGTDVFSSSKEKKYIMTKDHHTTFSHDVGTMLIFEWHDESFYVKKTDVMDFEDGSIMKLASKKAKEVKDKAKKQKIEKSENPLDGIKNTEVVNNYKFRKKVKDSLGYKREQMPQVSNKHLDKLLVHFGDKAKVKELTKKVNTIKFAQGEINEEKVLSILGNEKKIKKQLKRTYIISLDGYLLDGHHGISALLEEKGEEFVKVKRISLPFKNLKKRVNQMKISKKVDLDDKNV